MKQTLLATVVIALTAASAAAQAPKQLRLKVDDVTREALVYAPAAGKDKAPVVFAFHGHGGTAQNAAKHFNLHRHWPQAVVVYMQGLPIASGTDPQGKKAGWQHRVGDADDRDLKFFDQTLVRLKKDYAIDDARIYAMGHSNGGGFTYVLWAARGDTLAAVAPSSAAGINRFIKELTPKPALHVAGKKDPIVPFDRQEQLMDAIRALNGCEAKGQPWGKQGTLYPSPGGTPFVAVIHPGGHEFFEGALPSIVRFFQEHAKK